MPVGQFHPVNHPETVPAELSWLVGHPGWPWSPALEPMRVAAGLAANGAFQVPTGYMQHGIDVQLAVAGPHLAERDPLSVAQEPGRLMVQGGDTLLQRPDTQEHVERLALAAEGFTTWRSAHAFRSGV